MTPAFKRILLKLSGEALMGDLPTAPIPIASPRSPDEVGRVHDRGVEIAVVVGGGNIYRGPPGAPPRDGPGHRRLHGHARHRS